MPKEVCTPVTRQECREVTYHDVDARDVGHDDRAGDAGDDGDDDDENLSLGKNTER